MKNSNSSFKLRNFSFHFGELWYTMCRKPQNGIDFYAAVPGGVQGRRKGELL
jgi:hypothetical protein